MDAIHENGTDGDASTAEAKRRYWHAHAEVEELEAESKAGTLIPYVMAEMLFTETIAALRAEIDGNAGRLAPVLAAETDAAVVRRVLLDDYRGACDRAAKKVSQLQPSE